MDIQFRLNVTAANFPLLSSLHGRSLLTKAPTDSNYVVTNAYGGASADRDVGIPTFMYMHNVMPTITGVVSVGYKNLTNGTDATCKDVYPLRTCEEYRHMYQPTTTNNWLLTGNTWKSIGGFANDKQVTYAHIHKATYICHANSFVQKLDEASEELELVFFKGMQTNKLEGITHANNYLIGYTGDTIYYSSVLDSEEFTPTLKTLAGSIIPLHVRGRIVYCLPIFNGFMIFTAVNMVRATYSGNNDMPFHFMEVPNSGGVKSLAHVSHDNNYESFVAWTSKGLQLIPKENGGAEQLFPEVTDFFTSHIFEDYIGSTAKRSSTNESGVWSSETETWATIPEGYDELKQTVFDGELNIKVAVIASRYIVLSYSLPETDGYTHALVYDVSFKRWGKLRVAHRDCFELDQADYTEYKFEANHQIAFLRKDGVIFTLDMNEATTDLDSVLFFGKIEHSRNKITTLHSIEIENTLPEETELSILTSLDGKNSNPALYPLRQIDTKNLSLWRMRTTGINHTLKLLGTFNLVSIQGMVTLGGSR